jgi:2-polyprenyl-3-methyl-5-hydroxy-6-metoxy-1,4-benzoquinol methylase
MSVQYYQDNAQQFFNDTVAVDMSELYAPFVSRLELGALILDAGCGSGRDSKAFLDMGFGVEAFDASSEMVKLATELTALNVAQMRFEEVSAIEKYDAIWSCASLLHVQHKELIPVMSKLARSLKSGGIWYLSFKYGDAEREKGGRVFTDLNEQKLIRILESVPSIELSEFWITNDKRPDRDERWLNCLLYKIG